MPREHRSFRTCGPTIFLAADIAPKSELDHSEQVGGHCSNSGAIFRFGAHADRRGFALQSMAFFWYNPFSGEKLSSQFINYLQARSFVADIRDTMVQSAAASAWVVMESFDAGITRLEQQNAEFKSIFDWRLSLIHDQQKVTNATLRTLAKLLRVPDIEKERLHLIEQAFLFYCSAAQDPDLFRDALDYLHRAESLKPQDYHVLHRIGLIHLQSGDPRFVDLAKAEQYLRRAAKYARADINGPHRKTNSPVLELDQRQTDDDETIVDEAARIIAVECFRLAAVACFVQEKYSDALFLAEDACKLVFPSLEESPPTYLEAAYIKAKALVALNRPDPVPQILEDIIEQAPVYALRIAFDFGQVEPVLGMLTKLRDSKVRESRSLWNNCRKFVRPASNEAFVLYRLNAELAKNTLIAALDAEPQLQMTWRRLVEQQQDRMLEVAQAHKQAREQLVRIIADKSAVQELLDKKRAEEESQNRKWLLKDNTELERLDEELSDLAPEGLEQLDAQKQALEAECRILSERLLEERKQSLEMQTVSSTEAPLMFSEDFLEMALDLCLGRTEISEAIFENVLGLSTDEASALVAALERRGFIATGQKSTPRKILVTLDETPVWQPPWLGCPRTRQRL